MYIFDSDAFATRLIRLYKGAGYTQETFAKAADMSLSTLKSYIGKKKSEPSATSLYKMAKCLGVSIESLLTDDSDEMINKNITPQDIINSINTLVGAYGYNCIKEKDFNEILFDTDELDEITVKYNAICINDDTRIQRYLEKLRTKGDIIDELKTDEEDAANFLLKKWANIEGCVFQNKLIYNPETEGLRYSNRHNCYSVYNKIFDDIDDLDAPF